MCLPAQLSIVMVQENATLCSAIAVSQQQLHEAAAAAEGRAVGEAAQALHGEQQAVKQAHLLVHTCLYSILVRFVISLMFHWLVQNACCHVCMWKI